MRVSTGFSSPRAKQSIVTCGAWMLPSGSRTAPGLTVVKAKWPSASVAQRPQPQPPS